MAATADIGGVRVLAGREREEQAWAEMCAALKEGRGGLLWISGEAGIGKTALMQWLRDRAAQDGFRTLWGRQVQHEHSAPLFGLRDALARLFHIEPTDGPQHVKRKVEAALSGSWPELLMHRPALTRFLEPADGEDAGFIGIGEKQATIRVHHMVFRVMAAVSRRTPLIAFLDDCHWADSQSLDVLDYVGAMAGEERVLVVGAFRPEEPTPAVRRIRALVSERHSQAWELNRLDLSGVIEIAEAHGLDPNDVAFCEHLLKVTEGVPLFVEQWLLHGASMASGERPAKVTQVIARRLDNLAPRERSLLRGASVVGERCLAALLARVVSLSLPEVLEGLERLEEQRLMRPDGEDYAFSHVLIRQVTYEDMASATRQRLHLRAGEALEEELRAKPEGVFEVARHFGRANQPDRAVVALARAGQRALALKGFVRAEELFQEATATAAQVVADPELRAEIAEGWGDAAGAQGRWDAARERWEESMQLQASSLRRSLLCLKLATVPQRKASTRPSPYWSRALQETEDHPLSAERLEALMNLINVPRRVDARGGASYAAEALRIVRARSDDRALGRLSILLSHLKDARVTNQKRSIRHLRRAVRLCTKMEDWDTVIEAHLCLAETWRGIDLERAVREGEKGLALATDYLPPGNALLDQILSFLVKVSRARGDVRGVAAYSSQLRSPRRRDWRDLESVHDKWTALTEAASRRCPQDVGLNYSTVHTLTQLLRLATQDESLRPDDVNRFIDSLQLGVVSERSMVYMPGMMVGDGERAGGQATEGDGVRVQDLVWRNQAGNSRYVVVAADAAEIHPGPEVGLGWLNCAPCLLRRADADFVVEVCIDSDSHPQRSGGLVVWHGQQIVRLASGVDHIGQVSFGWHDRHCLRYASAGYLPQGDLHLRLRRRGNSVEGQLSQNGEEWRPCGAIPLEGQGPTEVGLFAECNYEYGFPQPFPVKFRTFRMKEEKPRGVKVRGSRGGIYPLAEEVPVFCEMVGKSRAFQDFCEKLERIALSVVPLLISGETGTGKELAARAAHRLSSRSDGPWISRCMAEIPEHLAESELFGFRRGAFTGADRDKPGLFDLAHGGSLLMDEIGEMPVHVQAKLLRAVDTGEIFPLGGSHVEHVDVRFIGASNRNLDRCVDAGIFREDLYYRFGEPLEVPPLRKRREDIPFLVSHFMQTADQHLITREAMECLVAHSWPGNVRELRNVLEGAMLKSPSSVVETEHLALRRRGDKARRLTGDRLVQPDGSARLTEAPSAEELRRLWEQTSGSVVALGRELSVDRTTLYRWFKKRGLDIRVMREAR